jgi:hypothetical protein
MKSLKQSILLLLISSVVISYTAQTPFYTFLNGWRGAGVTEVDGYIYTVSNYQEYNSGFDAESWIKLHKVDYQGNVLEEKNLRVDSSDLEGINVLGYGAVSFEEDNNWLLTNFNTYPNVSFYNQLYRFSPSFDTVDKSVLLSFTLPLGTSQGFVRNMKYVNDTTIILAGTDRNSFYNIRVMSVDTSGHVNWTRNIYSSQSSQSSRMNSIQISTAADGGYFVSCTDVPDLPDIGDDNRYFLLIKLSKDGVVEWKKRITDGVHVTNPGSVVQKDSNSYLVSWADSWLIEYPNWVVGNRKGLDSASVWLGEIDLQGNFKWKKKIYGIATNCDTIKNSDSYFSYNTLVLSDGNFLICVDNFGTDATYIKVTPEGEVIWNRRIVLLQEQVPGGLFSYTNIKYTKEASDGGILGIGEYYSDQSPLFPNGKRTSLLIKLDQYGCIEPGCHLEGCTDPEALNYNPAAVYDCGCQYDPCPDGNQITIKARHFRDLRLIDFELYKASDPTTNLLSLDGSTLVNEEHYNESACVANNCEEEYILHIDYHRTIAPNSELPFESGDPYKLGYRAYYQVLVNNNVLLDLGQQIFSKRDTTFRFSFCIPDTTPVIENFNLYPNPTKDFFNLEVPIKENGAILTLKVVDVLGREILEQSILNSQTIISVANWSVGLYTAVVYKGDTPVYTSKVIKQ